MRTTSRTPSRTSTSRGSNSGGTPTAPSTVCDAPVERWMSEPIETSRSITCWICSSFAPSCITTTIATPVPASLRFHVAQTQVAQTQVAQTSVCGFPPVHSDCEKLPRSIGKPQTEVCATKAVLPRLAFLFSFIAVHHDAFHGTRFVQDALEEAANGGVWQRAGVRLNHAIQNLLLAVGLVERIARDLFDVSDLDRTARAFVQ